MNWIACLLLTVWDGIAWSEHQIGNVVEIEHKPVYCVFVTEPVTDHLHELTCTFSVQGDEAYAYRGQHVWNTAPVPANVRFFFTSSTNVYNVPYAGTHQHEFWWSFDAAAYISNGTQTIWTSIAPEHFSSALGCKATNCVEAFIGCVQNAKRVGLSLSGGNFYDMGIALTNGTATIQILDFRVNPANNQEFHPIQHE